MTTFITVRSLKCAYETMGTGRDVVLLHGWGQSRAFWANIQERLAQEFTVHSIDLPGFGLSDEPPVPWGVREYAEFVYALVQQLGIAPPIIIGHSFGGKIAAVYAACFPVHKLVLYSASGLATQSLRKVMHGYLVQLLQYVAPNTIYRLHSIIFKPKDYRNQPLVHRGRSRRMLAVYLNIYRANIESLLGQIQGEVLLIYGRRDTIVTYDVGLRMVRLIQHGQLLTFHQSGHFAHFEEREQFMRAVETFLARP